MKTLLFSVIVVLSMLGGCRNAGHRRPVERGASTAGDRISRGHSIIYPYSVVAGGVNSAEDIREAMARDPQVKAHYAGIDIASLRVTELKSGTQAYVSFRKNGTIYWTATRVRLVPGELILTDGKQCVRGRCGNRISWTPASPTLPGGFREPTSGEFLTPALRGQSIDELPLPPILGELIPNVIPPEILIASTRNLPGYIGSGGTGGIGGGGPGAGGGGGGGGDADSDVDGSIGPGYITGAPVVIVPPEVYPGSPSFPIPGGVTPPGPPPATGVIFPGNPEQPTPPGNWFPPHTPGPSPEWTTPPAWNPPAPQWPTHPGNPEGPPDTPVNPPDSPRTPETPPDGPHVPDQPGSPPTVPEGPPPINPGEVPEPATVVTAAAGLAILIAYARRGRKRLLHN